VEIAGELLNNSVSLECVVAPNPSVSAGLYSVSISGLRGIVAPTLKNCDFEIPQVSVLSGPRSFLGGSSIGDSWFVEATTCIL